MSRSSRPDTEDTPPCPFCGSTDVELEAPFGGSLMTRQFYCRGCRTVFEHVKWIPEEEAGDWLGDQDDGRDR